jgi:hypothetical protein
MRLCMQRKLLWSIVRGKDKYSHGCRCLYAVSYVERASQRRSFALVPIVSANASMRRIPPSLYGQRYRWDACLYPMRDAARQRAHLHRACVGATTTDVL